MEIRGKQKLEDRILIFRFVSFFSPLLHNNLLMLRNNGENKRKEAKIKIPSSNFCSPPISAHCVQISADNAKTWGFLVFHNSLNNPQYLTLFRGVGKFTYPSGFLQISEKIGRPQACDFLTFNFDLFYTFSENFSPIGGIVPELWPICWRYLSKFAHFPI